MTGKISPSEYLQDYARLAVVGSGQHTSSERYTFDDRTRASSPKSRYYQVGELR